MLAERRSKTEGAIEKARADIASAEARTAEYEQRLREARAAIFKRQEARRQQALQVRAAAVAEARGQSASQMDQARAAIEQDKQVGARWAASREWKTWQRKLFGRSCNLPRRAVADDENCISKLSAILLFAILLCVLHVPSLQGQVSSAPAVNAGDCRAERRPHASGPSLS